jgi:O-antigen/teichoic acid export membrane protein
MKSPEVNVIALISLLAAVILMAFLFFASRNDPSLRIAALVAGTGLVSSLSSIASTILTGKDVTKPANPTQPGESSNPATLN